MHRNNPNPAPKLQKVESPSQRTVRLVEASINVLKARRLSISIEKIATISREIDPEGNGVCRSAITRNVTAKSLYIDQRSWRPGRTRPRPDYLRTEINHPKQVNDIYAKRRRLNERYRKSELIDIVIELQRQQGEMGSAIANYARIFYDKA